MTGSGALSELVPQISLASILMSSARRVSGASRKRSRKHQRQARERTKGVVVLSTRTAPFPSPSRRGRIGSSDKEERIVANFESMEGTLRFGGRALAFPGRRERVSKDDRIIR